MGGPHYLAIIRDVLSLGSIPIFENKTPHPLGEVKKLIAPVISNPLLFPTQAHASGSGT